MNRSRLLVTNLLAVALIAAVVSGCASPAPAPAAAPAAQAEVAQATAAPAAVSAPAQAEPVEITFIEHFAAEWGLDTVNELVTKFNDTHPNIRVKLVDSPNTELIAKLEAAATSKSDSYDVFTALLPNISSLVKQAAVEDLDPWLEKDAEFTDSLLSITPLKLLGDTRALCFTVQPYHVLYNTEILAEKGLNPPSSWDEFVQLEQTLRNPATGDYGISLAASQSNYITIRLFGTYLAQQGGRYLDDEGNVAFNSPEGVAAFEFWKDFIEKDLVVPGYLSEGETTSIGYLASGKIATVLNGPWVVSTAKQTNPNLKLAYAPAFENKTGGMVVACTALGMSANSKHKEEAWEFMKYLYSEPVAVKVTEKASIPLASKAAVASMKTSDDLVLQRIPELMEKDPEYNITYPILPNMTKCIDALKQAFQETVTGKKDAQVALDEAAAVWQKELDAAR